MEHLLDIPYVEVGTGTEMASVVHETLDNCGLKGKAK